MFVIRKRSPFRLIASAAAPTAAVLFMLMFAGYAVLGTNGLLARGEYRKQLGEAKVKLAQVEAEKNRLLNRKKLLAHGDHDLADELTRGATEMVGDDEYVIVTK
ncbi:septum formation initiator [Sphingomonas sp. KC8]|uniref:septum formation initiator n=1 Tax=Sphingomonas sp. KC8 TaxID=1030157 RepID=UPI000248A40D|nr:septum formation initiator [Sphingomonas sp. KC8]ARS27365.1 septum formation initiator [Sphingomonas sp. KC8]